MGIKTLYSPTTYKKEPIQLNIEPLQKEELSTLPALLTHPLIREYQLQNESGRAIEQAKSDIEYQEERKQREIKVEEFKILKDKQLKTKDILFKDRWNYTILRKEQQYLTAIINTYVQKEMKKGISFLDIQTLMNKQETKEYFKTQIQKQIKINIDNGTIFEAYIHTLRHFDPVFLHEWRTYNNE